MLTREEFEKRAAGLIARLEPPVLKVMTVKQQPAAREARPTPTTRQRSRASRLLVVALTTPLPSRPSPCFPPVASLSPCLSLRWLRVQCLEEAGLKKSDIFEAEIVGGTVRVNAVKRKLGEVPSPSSCSFIFFSLSLLCPVVPFQPLPWTSTTLTPVPLSSLLSSSLCVRVCVVCVLCACVWCAWCVCVYGVCVVRVCVVCGVCVVCVFLGARRCSAWTRTRSTTA